MIFASTLGASGCFFVSTTLAKYWVFKFFPNRVLQFKGMVENNKDYLFFYILFLRITPFFPNWLLNLSTPSVNYEWNGSQFAKQIASLDSFTPEELLQVATGFVKGIGIFQDVHFCNPSELVDKVKEVGKTLLEVVKAKDYMKALKLFAESIKDVAVVAGKVAHDCDATEKELLAIVDKLVAYLSNDKFPQKLINHSILNSVKLLKMVSDLKKDFTAKTPNEFGVELGEFVNFALLFGY